MLYSYTIEKAIRAATVLHAGQVCAGKVPYPYITHIFAVAMIVSDYTNDENTIVASLLYDTLGATGYRPKDLENDFGAPVRSIVSSIAKPTFPPGDTAALLEAQRAYVKNLKSAPEEGLLILAASTTHTMRAVVEEYVDDIDGFIVQFGRGTDGELFWYQEISNALNRKLTNSILSEFNDVFTEYKNFIHHVSEETTARAKTIHAHA